MQKNNRKKCKIMDTSIKIIDGDRGKHYPKNNELLPHGFCLFLNTKNLPGSVFDFSSTQFISQEKDSTLRKGKLQNNDIVFTTRGTLGHLAWFKDNILYKNVRINSGMVILRNKDNLIDTKFLFLQLASSFVRKQIASLSTGSAQPQLPIKDFLNLEIYLPPIEEQKRIAGVLGAFDDKIELLQKQNTTLENMAKALFKSWFVDFDVVHAKQQGQPKAAVMQQYHLTEELYNLFPSSFEPSALGPIPTGWQVKAAQEIANILIGRTPPRKESKWFSNNSKNHVWISIKDLGNCGIFINNSSEYLTEEAVNKFRISIIPANTVVLSFKLTVGRVAISGRNMLSNEAIAQFQNSILPPSYLYFTLKNTNFSSLGSTSSIATAINSNTIKHMDILVANTKIIDIFTNEVEPLFNKIQTNNKQIQTLTEMRDALLPRLISGKIRV